MRWTAPVAAAAVLCGVVSATGHAAPPPGIAAAGASQPASPAADFGPGASESSDIAVNAFGDENGYHIQVGTEKSGFTWREVALLRPADMDDSSWTGYQCTSGDGRYEAVAVLPTSAVNTVAALEHGAFAYSVDLVTGAVKPIATGVALRYHSPGCGTGDQAAFSVSLGDSEQTTEILTANLATGAVQHATTVAGQLTSAVPVGGDVIAASGSHLVSVPMTTGTATATPLAATPGQAYDLRPALDGGVDFLSMRTGAKTATVEHEHAGSVTAVGTGPAATLALFQGRGGRNTVVGATRPVKGSTLRSVSAGSLGSVGAASLDGDALLGDQQSTTTADASVLATDTGHMVSRGAATADAAATTSYSTLVPSGVPAAPTDATPSATTGGISTTPAASSPKAATSPTNQTAAVTGAASQTPACAVPRDNPTFQVTQPGSSQVDWAVQMAEQNLLTGSAYARPANFNNMGLVSYSPNSDFAAVPLLHPSSDTWNTVPRSVFEAVMAQESNWDQASWHALPGIAGNPIVADYYGAAGTIDTINYSASDCGYGISQVTTGMFASQTGQEYSLHGQEKIAVDYEENIAAGLQILENTWNSLYTAGITVNGGDPKYLENWYFALWAYNTGIEPDAAHGNTTGCTPGPTCASPDGTWGLGWANNPANPAFPPNRQPYLAYTYADAAHPGSWPYQERVLGWMGTPLVRMGAHAYAGATYNGGNNWLTIPAFNTFCSTAGNDCAPGAAGQSGTCTLADSECWWHTPITWIPNCSTTCSTSSYTVGSGSTQPAVTDPHPPVCGLDTSVVPTGSNGPPIIVSAQVGLAAGATPADIVGCPATENWSNGGTFAMSYGTDANGDPTGAIDTQQLGAGLGGYIMFDHTQNGSEAAVMNTGTWTPTLPKLQYYKIKIHLPATGATATDVVYDIYPGGSASPWKIRVNQDWGSDQWVTIGTFAMQNGGSVQLSNQSSMTPGGYDVGYDAIAFLPQGGTPGTPIGGPPGVMDAPEGSNPAFVNCGCVTRTAGDPVDTATGYYGDSDTDLTTPGRGMPLDFTRTYASALADPAGPNAANSVNGPFGHGWTFSYGLSAVTNATSGNVTVNQEDGSQVTFIDSSGSYAPSAPRYDASLTKSGTTYTYTRKGAEIFRFDTATGRLTAETDLAGANASTPYATTLAYNAGGQLSTVTDPAGHVYTLGWTGTHITSLTDSAGREVSYGYSAAGDLTDVYGVGTTRTPTLQNNDHTTYTYTAAHLLNSVRQPKYYGDTTTSPTPVMSMLYDSSERVLSQTDPLGHTTTFTYGPNSSPSLVAGQTLVTDPAGHQTLDTYQGGLLTSEVNGYSSTTPSTTSYTYDPATLGVSTVTDPNGDMETYSYDDHGNKISSSDAAGHTTAYTYDALDDLTSVLDPLGVLTSYGYDQAGHIAVSGGTNTGTLTFGLPTSTTVAQVQQSADIVNSNPAVMPSRTVGYYYDDAAHPGDRTRAVDANGNTSTTSYDADGEVAKTTDAMGDSTENGYDTGTGQLTSTVTPDGVAAGVVPGCTPPAKGCITYGYDAFGNVTTTTDPLGHATSAKFDANGNQTTAVDADGNTTTYTYDPSNAVTATTAPDNSVSHTAYNADGTISSTTDAGNNSMRYIYDSQARVTSETDQDNRKTTYTYDPSGDVLTVTNPASQVTTYSYTPTRRVASVKYSDGKTPAVAISYDADGKQTAMTDASGSSTWSYDAFGDVVSESNGAGATTGYSYDNNGNQTSISYPGTTSQTVTRTFDKADRLSAVTDWNTNKTQFGYDGNSSLTATTYPNGDVVTNTFNGNDLESSSGITQNGATLASLTYTRDPAGQITGLAPAGLPGSAETYTYTANQQLKSATAGTATTSYTYDAANNPTTQAGSGQSFDAAHQLCWTLPGSTSTNNCASAPTGATTYSYDTQGNRTGTTPATGPASTYTFSQNNQMTAYSGPGRSATYTYDGLGLRTSKTVGSVASTFDWNTVGTPTLLSDGTSDYIYGPNNQPIEQLTGATPLWYFHDVLGSTRALLNSSGSIAGAYAYDSYGNVTAHTGTAVTPLQYGGGYTDSETGFVYLKARYYDPATAQFTSVDPALRSTQAAYTYAGDNPLNEVDPSGLCGLEMTAKGNQKSSEFANWTDAEVQAAYDDPKTPAALKQKLNTELKARGLKGSRASKDKKTPKKSKGTNNFTADAEQVGIDVAVGVVAVVIVAAVVVAVAAVVISAPIDAAVAAVSAVGGALAAVFSW